MKKFHHFHMVSMSPWPIMASFSALANTSSMIMSMMYKSSSPAMMSMMSIFLTTYQWWRDVIREGSFLGNHSQMVVKGMKMGMILFIASEVMFFVSFFWAYYYSSLSPDNQLGGNWPAEGIVYFNPMGVALLNTLLLLSSGMTITWAHHSMMENNLKESITAMTMTILLGMYFSILQGFEYWQAGFTMSDTAYGACFFMTTGFHGLHVLVGATFMIVNLIQMVKTTSSNNHFLGFEAAAWYWHFVDVVWMMLYGLIYWWVA